MKKLTLLALALMMLVSSAFAASSPSITNKDMYKVTTTTTTPAQETDPLAGLVIRIDPETDDAKAVLEKIKSDAAGKDSLVDAVFAEQAEAVKGLLKVEKLDEVKLIELASLIVSGYKQEMGAIQANLAFPTLFDANLPLVAMIGMIENDTVAWEPLLGTANAQGEVVLTLSPELLLKVQAGNAVIAILK